MCALTQEVMGLLKGGPGISDCSVTHRWDVPYMKGVPIGRV